MISPLKFRAPGVEVVGMTAFHLVRRVAALAVAGALIVASPSQATPEIGGPEPAASAAGRDRLVEAERIFAEAVAVAPVLPCGPVRLVVEPMMRTAFASSDCSVHVQPEVIDPDQPDWWAPFIMRHEVAHLATMADGLEHGHDLVFREILAGMLRPLRIVEDYYDAEAQIPMFWWRDGVCLRGCPG